MIAFQNVSKSYQIKRFTKEVLRDLTFTIPDGEGLGILGANGAGKSTLMRLISGVESPTKGHIVRTGNTSWPIGYTSCFQSSLTGADNARFIARIYGRDSAKMIAFVEDFAQLGPYLHQPIYTYSAGMSARLAFGVSLAIDFDTYLVDEVTSAGDERFRERCEAELLHRSQTRTIVLISHEPNTLRAYCKRGAVLSNGRLTFYDNLDDAIEAHHVNQTTMAA